MLGCVKLFILLAPFVCQLFVANAAEVLPGYVLYAPATGSSAHLLDETGTVVHEWTGLQTGNVFSVHLKKNGNIIRPTNASNNGRTAVSGASSGLIQEIDPLGNVVWEFEYSTDDYCQHHNLILMPNEHILAVAYDRKTVAEALEKGIPIDTLTDDEEDDGGWGGWFGGGAKENLLSERFIEIDPTRPKGEEIVWTWNMWDHITDSTKAPSNPQLFGANLGDVNGSELAGFDDWVHLNGFDYNEHLDQIVFSSRLFSEIYIIDHSTSTKEAATSSGGKSDKGGDILYRWGKPSNYNAPGTDYLNVVHCPNWVPEGFPGEGNILMFSNRIDQSQSQVLEINPPLKSDGVNYEFETGKSYGPEKPFWTYTDTGFSSTNMSSCQRLSNGNTLICEAAKGRIREVSPDGETLWTYTAKSSGGFFGGGTMMARAIKYEPDYIGIKKLLGISANTKKNTVNRNASIQLVSGKVEIKGASGSKMSVFSIQGKKMLDSYISGNRYSFDIKNFSRGTYIVNAVSQNGTISKRISVAR